jgi:hypothetical protein
LSLSQHFDVQVDAGRETADADLALEPVAAHGLAGHLLAFRQFNQGSHRGCSTVEWLLGLVQALLPPLRRVDPLQAEADSCHLDRIPVDDPGLAGAEFNGVGWERQQAAAQQDKEKKEQAARHLLVSVVWLVSVASARRAGGTFALGIHRWKPRIVRIER